MTDSLNERHRLSLEDYKKYKKELREKYNKCNINNLFTSLYYEYFDDNIAQKLNRKHAFYFDIAAKIAQNSNMYQKHGALIVYKKTIISSGTNNYLLKSSKKYSTHAEISAINKVKNKKQLSECEMYIVRIGPDKFNNMLKYSKPCINCQNYINKYNIKKIYYSTNYEYDSIVSSSESNSDSE
jgi:deoxycytidylate deaminase